MVTRHTLLGLLIGAVAGMTMLAGCVVPPGAQLTPTPVAGRPVIETSATLPTKTPQETATPMPSPGACSTPATPIGPTDTSSAVQARLDLARRLNVPADQVEVVSVEKTEMPVGSLGCGPTGGVEQPGIIIGDEIVLAAGGQEYTYRSDGRRLVPCSPAAFPGGREPASLAGGSSTELEAQTAALNDLAERLSVAKSAIKVVRAEAMQWPDASLGCPQPGMMYAQVITPGYRIVLEANGKQYEYHTGRGARVVLCTK